jgi:hypothetical protein
VERTYYLTHLFRVKKYNPWPLRFFQLNAMPSLVTFFFFGGFQLRTARTAHFPEEWYLRS